AQRVEDLADLRIADFVGGLVIEVDLVDGPARGDDGKVLHACSSKIPVQLSGGSSSPAACPQSGLRRLIKPGAQKRPSACMPCGLSPLAAASAALRHSRAAA